MTRTRSRKSPLLAHRTPSKQDTEMVDLGDSTAQEGVDEISQTPDSKRIKVSQEFEQRFIDLSLADRAIIPGLPISSKFVDSLQECGALKLFQDLGLEAFLLGLPRVYYPDLVREFYANLHTDKYGSCVSTVKGKKIQLNAPFLSTILQIDTPSEIDVFTATGFNSTAGMSISEQLQTVMGSDILDQNLPTTTVVTPLAHLLFKLCRSHFCPRLGNKSNFTCQDVIVVAMLMNGKPFDVSELILKKMLGTLDKAVAGIPYGLILTRIFEAFKVDLKKVKKTTVKEAFDQSVLSANNLQIVNGVLERITIKSPTKTHVTEPSSSAPVIDISAGGSSASLLLSLQDDNAIILGKISGLDTTVQELKSDLLGISADLKALKAVVKDFKDMLVHFTGCKSSTAQSTVDTEFGLEDIKKAGANDDGANDVTAPTDSAVKP